jgi:hypothetical protein
VLVGSPYSHHAIVRPSESVKVCVAAAMIKESFNAFVTQYRLTSRGDLHLVLQFTEDNTSP